MVGIYKITNPQGKIYIGQSINIEKRWKSYKSKYCAKGQHLLRNSLKKYKFENHVFEIIIECTVNELNYLERYYQELYNSVGINGLNLKYTTTTDKSGYLSNLVKLKISNSLKGKNLSQNHKQKISNAHKGKKLSKEHINKIKYTKQNIANYNKGKSILMICSKTNSIIKEYEKISWVKQDGYNPNAVQNVLKGISKTSSGYIWKYKN